MTGTSLLSCIPTQQLLTSYIEFETELQVALTCRFALDVILIVQDA